MATISLHYNGELSSTATHEATQNTVDMEAPVDNGGKGGTFCPTDLVASALGGCAITVMALKAKALGVPFERVEVTVDKVMGENPRRISALTVDLHIHHHYSAEVREKLEAAAHSCPVGQSLHPEIRETLNFHYED